MIVPRSSEPIEIPGSRVKVALWPGGLARLGAIVCGLGASRALVVSDAGVVAAGHAERAVRSLGEAGVAAEVFSGVEMNPTTFNVDDGVAFARGKGVDVIVGLGGGRHDGLHKGINFILSSGGWMQDYEGVGLAKNRMLPMVAVPTTAGTGSEAQSFALITDHATHRKMACGDARALPRAAILDAELTATQPAWVAAATGIDAVAHAVETSATTRRNDVSRRFSRAAWGLLSSSFEKAMAEPGDLEAREAMLLGSHLAGAAIENSMLGAAHALANALTELCWTPHGVAVGLMLPHVVRFNAEGPENPYGELEEDAGRLAERIDGFLRAGGLPRRLTACDVKAQQVPELAQDRGEAVDGGVNPRWVGEEELRGILERAI